MPTQPTRRAVLGAALAAAGTGALAACSDGGGGDHGGGHSPGGAQNSDTYVSPGGKEVEAAEAARGSGPVRKVSSPPPGPGSTSAAGGPSPPGRTGTGCPGARCG